MARNESGDKKCPMHIHRSVSKLVLSSQYVRRTGDAKSVEYFHTKSLALLSILNFCLFLNFIPSLFEVSNFHLQRYIELK